MNKAIDNKDIMGVVFKWTQEFTPAQVCRRWKTIFDTVREDISLQILSDIEKGLGYDKFYKLKNRIRILTPSLFLKALFRDLIDEKPDANISKVPNAADYLALNQELDDEENIRFTKTFHLGRQFLSRPQILLLSSRAQVKKVKNWIKTNEMTDLCDDIKYPAATRCPTLIFKLTNLTRLDLSMGKIKTLPPKFFCLTLLRSLSLEGNPVLEDKKEMGEFKKSLSVFPNLINLNLTRDGIGLLNKPLLRIEKFFDRDIESGQPTANLEVNEELDSLLRNSLKTKVWKWRRYLCIASVVILIMIISAIWVAMVLSNPFSK
jgi:hypothetical protein